jgi:hypothetical protein
MEEVLGLERKEKVGCSFIDLELASIGPANIFDGQSLASQSPF